MGACERGREELSVDVNAKGKGVERVRGWNDVRAEEYRVHVDTSDDGREEIGVYVRERMRGKSAGRKVQVRSDGVRRANGSVSSVKNEGCEGSGNIC